MINLKTILAFLKANIKYVILIAIILFAGVWSCSRERIIVNQAKKLTELTTINAGLATDRTVLELKLIVLQDQYIIIAGKNDSMKLVLAKYQLELVNLKKQHAKEIEVLLNVPADTVYLRLNVLFPNYDSGEQRFRFAESQIKPIYSNVLQYPMLQAEYSLQGKSLNACLGLNSGYESGIKNLNSQISNLQDNIGKADLQIGNYKKSIIILNRQVGRKQFWNRALWVATSVATGIAIFK